MNRRRLLGQRGDTIIEVMVVLTVLGLALSISFATANRSLLAARQAQENTQASLLLQSQLEKLRFMAPNSNVTHIIDAANPDTNVFHIGGAFCIGNAPSPPVPAAGPYAVDTTLANCIFDSRGSACTDEPCYTITINYTNAATAPHTFSLSATWDDVTGQGQNSVGTVYRTHGGAP